MRALTIRQPWAQLVVMGTKVIETRSWKAPDALVGQRIAIHAGAKRPDLVTFVGPYHVAQGGTWLHGPGHDKPMPFGAVVGSAVLAACVPMVDLRGEGTVYRLTTDPHLKLFIDHPPWGGRSEVAEIMHYPRPARSVDVSDQLPFGDFAPGRWAWLLADAAPTTTRCPLCWDEVDDLMAALARSLCRACRGVGHCPPIPAKGRQGIWEWAP
jgi:activating signal cointegrator 1